MADIPTPEELGAQAFAGAERERIAQLRLSDEAPTESKVAHLFVEAHQGAIAYCPEQSRWYTRKDTHSALWTMDVTNHVGTLVAEHVDRLSARYDPKHARTMQRAAFVNGVEALAKRDRRIILEVPAMDAAEHVIGTPGGVYDLRTVVRLEDFSGVLTKSTACSPSFDEPGLWLQLLEDWCESAELRELLWRLAGYWASGSTREQTAAIIHGPAGTGKSSFCNAVLKVLGDYGMVAPVEMFLTTGMREHPTMLACLRGARLALVHEIPAGARFNESLFKSVVAGDPLAARYMRGDYFKFDPCVKVVFSANHLPGMTAHESMRRRILVLPFTRMVSRAARQKDLQARLTEEGPRILGWILQGARRWYAGGLPVVHAVDEASERYFEDADVIGAWLDDCLDLGPNHFAASRDLYKSWSDWAREHGERIGTQKALSNRLKERGYSAGRNSTGDVRGFRGLLVR
ncbi:MAG: hypothetical protein IT496_01615 [Gammaproteobacteria bacterium]|nr:hypothetical protein [Gammaproteobacteria bacterium]